MDKDKPLSRFHYRDKAMPLSVPTQGQKTTPKGVSLSLSGRGSGVGMAAVLPPPSLPTLHGPQARMHE